MPLERRGEEVRDKVEVDRGGDGDGEEEWLERMT